MFVAQPASQPRRRGKGQSSTSGRRCEDSHATMQTNSSSPTPASGNAGPPPAVSRRLVLPGLALGALGIVYGDIGTSPLYALRTCFSGPTGIAASHENVLGVLSLIFWALALIVSLKYIAFVLRADNRGEGGILALLALAFPERERAKASRVVWLLTGLGLFGAEMLYGEGLITPAITVLGGMPAHAHGLPTVPQVKELGGGRYLIEGLKFHMPGAWVVAFRIKAGSIVDSVRFDLQLE